MRNRVAVEAAVVLAAAAQVAPAGAPARAALAPEQADLVPPPVDQPVLHWEAAQTRAVSNQEVQSFPERQAHAEILLIHD
jgi:hypothetical protein